MGEIRYLSCEKCGYAKQVHTGGGIRSIRPEVVEETLKGEELEQWKALREKNAIKRFVWEYALGLCKECKELNQIFKVDIETKDGHNLLLDCRCEICQKKLQPIEREAVITCPICGQAVLKDDFVGHWD